MLKRRLKSRVLFVYRLWSVRLVFALVALTVATLSLTTSPAQAATNNQLNFQARLQTNTGGIVPDGYYNVQFNLYSASSGGSTLWTESHIDTNGVTAGNDFRVRVKNGYLTVSLGSLTSFPGTINWDQELWITMNIGGTTQTATPTYDGEMNPRLKLTGVPYAFRAGQLATGNGTLQSTLQILQPTVGNQIFQIRDQAAAGTYNLLTENEANGAYIQNQTASPQSAGFNISGNGTIGGNLNVTGNANLIKPGTNSVTAFQIQPSGSTTPVLNVDTSNSRIGIGTNAPSRQLHIVSGAGTSTGLRLDSTSAGGRNYSITSTNNTSGSGGGKLVIFDETAVTERLVVDSSGNVGIGLNNPTYKLDVYTNTNNQHGLRVTTANQNAWGFMYNNATFGTTSGTGFGIYQDDAGYSHIQSNGVESITLNANGNVGVYGVYVPGYALDVGGDINTSTQYRIGGNIALTGSALTFNAASAATIQSASTQSLTIDSGTTGALNLGTGANAKTITLGNTTGATTTNIRAGSGGISILGTTNINTSGTAATNIGTGSSTGDIFIGNQAGGNEVVFQANNITLDLSGNLAAINNLSINGSYSQSGSGTFQQSYSATTGTAATHTLTNTSGTQTNGLFVNRNGTGGTTTNGINFTNTLGTTTNGIAINQAGGTLTSGLAFSGTIGTDITRGSGTLTVQGAGGITLTSTSGNIQIGSATTDATATLLVLDSYNQATDPTGVNGAMYYNSDMRSMRCYANGMWADCSTGSMRAEWSTREDFAPDLVNGGQSSGVVGENSWRITLIGTGAALNKVGAATNTQDNDKYGILRLEAPATTNAGMSLMLDPTAMTTTPSNLSVDFSFGTVDANAAGGLQQILRIGLHDSTSTTAPVDGIYFQYSRTTTAGNWERCTSVGSTRTCTDTGVAYDTTVNNYHRFSFRTNSAGTSVEFFIDGTSVGSNTTNLPTNAGAYGPAIQWITQNAAARQWKIDYFQLKRNLTTLR